MIAPFTSLTSLAAFACGLLASPAAAELRQGPTGVEYAKRFTPSGVSPTVSCYYGCPYLDVPSGEDVPPTTIVGTPFSTGLTACAYAYEDQLGRSGTAQCVYNDNGNFVEGGANQSYPEGQCHPFAYTYDADGATECEVSVAPAKRRLSRLERVVKARQYKYPKKA